MTANDQMLKSSEASGPELSPDETDRIIAILDRMLDLAVSANWPVDRKEFFALQEQLADVTGLPHHVPR